MIQADQCLIDAVNRYKDGRTERTTRYEECFRKLPDEFRTQQFMDCFGCSQSSASKAITRFREDGVVEDVKYGLYRKVLPELP